MPILRRRITHSEPKQARSKQTLERIVRAAESLLETRSFDAIGVDDIARRARCSTGSFYARFTGKDALLPFIYERYDAELRPRIAVRMRSIAWSELTLRETCIQIASGMVDMYSERRHLLRAIALFARNKPDAIADDVKQRREGVHDMLALLLCRFLRERGQSEADALQQARAALFIIAAAARDKILFAEAPHASATPMSNATFKQELTRALYGYLTCD